MQDECSRLKVGHAVCDGPATGEDVAAVLEAAFAEHGAPLVIKRAGGAIFDAEPVRRVLTEHQVLILTSPPATPRYNGRIERAFRDVRGYERALRLAGLGGTWTGGSTSRSMT